MRSNAARRPDGKVHERHGHVFDPFQTLAWAAAFTSRIRLGTSVVVLPFHSPVDVARHAATLDQLSGGRLDLGVCSGWGNDACDVPGAPEEHYGEFYTVPLSEVNPKLLKNPLSLYDATTSRPGFRVPARRRPRLDAPRLTSTPHSSTTCTPPTMTVAGPSACTPAGRRPGA